jgi:hypothetical protein
MGAIMTGDYQQGSVWASVLAVLAVACGVGALYVPLALR